MPDTYPVSPDGAITWPRGGVPHSHTRRVILTADDSKGNGQVFGHRFSGGRHANTTANKVCTHCVVEAELTYLHTMWAIHHDLPNHPHRPRRHHL